jgi:GNAT domain-containint protein/N-acyltransferase family protein
MDASEVAARLRLGPEHAAWLRMLQAVGPPPAGLPAVPPDALDLAAITAEDRSDVVAALPNSQTPPEWLWLLERAFHAVRTDVGNPEGTRPMPTLPVVGAQSRCFWIAVFLCALDDIRRWHQSHGVSDEISCDTLADLGRHVRLYRQRNGATGLDTHWWISLHFRGALFAIGRLQYQPYHLQTGPAGPLFWYDEAAAASLGRGFLRGDPALGLHIPEAGPLTPAACADSFARARSFFHARFPEFAEAIATCTSWLLDDQLQRYLDPESNMLAFQRRFELVPGWRESDSSAFHFVFGSTADRIDQLEPRTTLEHAIVQHVKNGMHWGMRTGWLRLADQS